MPTATERKPDIISNTDTGEVTDGDGELFDPKPYDAPVPKLDGHKADKLKLAFGGSVEVDLMLEGNLEHFKSLRFGQEVELTVTAIVGKKHWAIRTDDEGTETVTHTVGLSVHSYEEIG